jgi:hypothetical protein
VDSQISGIGDRKNEGYDCLILESDHILKHVYSFHFCECVSKIACNTTEFQTFSLGLWTLSKIINNKKTTFQNSPDDGSLKPKHVVRVHVQYIHMRLSCE